MLTSGFFHEQSRADRDDFVEVMWDNIKSEMSNNFLKLNLNQIDHLGAPYNICSVVHYRENAFSKVANLFSLLDDSAYERLISNNVVMLIAL